MSKTRIIRRRTNRKSKTVNQSSVKQNSQIIFDSGASMPFFSPTPERAIQRQCDDCEKEDKKNEVQRVVEDGHVARMEAEQKEEEQVQRQEDAREETDVQKKESPSTTTAVNNSGYIGTLGGKGNQLPAKANYFFSSRMGYDFSSVKIHTGKEASESAKSLNAQAYTVGNNIVFNEGRYDTESSEGKTLLAHELAHVVQNKKASKKSLQKKDDKDTLAFSDELKKKMAATVYAETYPGQENDIAWIYYNLVKAANGEAGLKKSTAYRLTEDNYKIAMILLGDKTYSSDKPKEKWILKDKHDTLQDYIDKNEYVAKFAKPRATDTLKIIEAVIKDPSKNPYAGWVGQGNVDDFNRNDDTWKLPRAYYWLQESGEVKDKLVKVLEQGKNTQFVFDRNAIEKYFKANPKKKSNVVPKYTIKKK